MFRSIRLQRFVNILLVVCLLTTIYPAPLWAQAPAGVSAAAPATVQDAPAPAVPTSTPLQPAALDDALAVSRVQSSYVSNADTVVTFTVTNNQLPALAPDISGSTSVTDTTRILAGFVITDDMNTLRNVELETTLTNGTLVNGNGAAQSGSTLTWTLPDIAPQQSEQITVTLSSSASGSSFVELDDGAMVSAELWNQPVSKNARPITVIPDTVDPIFMSNTSDATIGDEDMLWVSAEFQQDPTAAFEYVRGFGYDPYNGSLRGTRGTLWSEAGNSLDQSSLLIAMLRSAGVPARYRHGTLSTTDAQSLIASMFSAPNGVAGYIPADATLSDPVNDPELIAVAQDHWWVEAYLPGDGWTDLDPSFATANEGDSFATPTTFDQISSVPASQQHVIELALRIEQYTAFPAGGDFLETSYPLTATIPTAEVAAKRIVFSQFVSEEFLGGLAFSSRQVTYLPYFAIEENNQAYLGNEFSDLFSSFPFTTHATVGAWLEYTVKDVDGNSETFDRVIKDLLGPDVRVNGGSPDLEFDSDSVQFFFPSEQMVHWVLPNAVPDWAYQRRVADSLPASVELMQQTEQLIDMHDLLAEDDISVSEYDLVLDVANQQITAQLEILSLMGLQFANSADSIISDIATGLNSNMFYQTPRLFAVGSQLPIDKGITTVDLRTTRSAVIVAPGQSIEAGKTAQWLKGIAESQLEGDVLEQTLGVAPVTTSRLFEAMDLLGIEPVKLTPDDMHLLDLYPFSDTARVHMRSALLEGKTIVVPSAEVMLNGEVEWAWWEIDPDTGETISVGEDGLHPGLVFYTLVKAIVESLVDVIIEFIISQILLLTTGGAVGIGPGGGSGLGPGLGGWIEDLAIMGENLANLFTNLSVVIGGGSFRQPTMSPGGWTFMPAHVCPIDNCGIEQFMLAGIGNTTMPLPEAAFVYLQQVMTNQRAGDTLAVTDNGNGGAPVVTLSTTPIASTTSVASSAAFDAQISANFADDFDLAAIVPDGWSVAVTDSGNVTATPVAGVVAGDYMVMLVAQAHTDRTLIATAEHSITVTSAESLLFDVAPEPNITIPQNAALLADVSNQTNDGQAEIPDSAYRVDIHNQSPVAKTFAVNVTGAPAGWIVLDGIEQTGTAIMLAPGAKTTVGLYIVPNALPAPGTSHTIDVAISDGGSLSDSAQINWAMPGQAHNFMTVSPETIYMGANDSAEFAIAMQNVGNVAGVFPVTATTPITTWTLSTLPDYALAIGASDTQTMTLTTVNGEIGRIYPLQIASPAPGSYTQYAFADVVIVSPDAEQLALATDEVAACSAEPQLAATFDAIFNTFSVLEAACTSGACNSQQRDAVVAAANLLIDTLGDDYPALDTSAASSAVATLAAANTVPNILAALPPVSSSVADLVAPLCAIASSQPALQWTPAYDAALIGESVSYALDLTNLGTLTSTYALTVELPTGQFTDTPTVDPGATESYNFSLSSVTPALIQVDAEVVAAATPLSNDDASAALNVVDKFIQLTAVTLDPEFVETGTSQTDVSVTIANLANVPIDADAVVAVLDDGGVVDSAEIPILIRPGNPRSYDLMTFDTSGYASGVYTVTVDLVDASDNPIDDGSGYAYLGVGQALGAAHYVAPELVMPGTVSVTTVISTEILVDTAAPAGTVTATPLWEPTGLRNANQPLIVVDQLPIDDSQLSSDDSEIIIASTTPAEDEQSTVNGQQSTANALNRAPAGYTRTEDTDTVAITYTGSWTSWGATPTSEGNVHYSNSIGDTAAFSFTGTWVNVGIYTRWDSATVEIFIDGNSQGIFDVYSNQASGSDFVFGGLTDDPHTITVAVVAPVNPNSTGGWVYLDYFDTWDGTPIPNGVLEQDSTDFIYSTNWNISESDATNASGDTYARSSSGSVWLPFDGDSISIDAYRYNGAGPADIYIDGQFVARADLYSAYATPFPITETISFSGLGSGMHLLTMRQHQANITLDRVTTPAFSADYDPSQTGIARIEEHDANIRYNGVSFTSSSWVYDTQGFPSRSFNAYNYGVIGHTVSTDFDGDWVSFGVVGDPGGGQIEVAIDGIVQETVDTYRRTNEPIDRSYAGIGAGPHTITLTVLGTTNPHSGYNRLYFDYFETWDGAIEPSGTFEADFLDLDRLRYSSNWSLISDGNAANSNYVRSNNKANIWFHFTGDSVTYEAFAYSGGDIADVWIDGVYQTTLDLHSASDISRTLTFDNLGAGPHVMLVHAPRGIATADRFHAPAIEPATVFACGAYCRYEENDPALRFNGDPLNIAAGSFFNVGNGRASDGNVIESRTVNDSVSLTFDGAAVGIGFLGHYQGGLVDVMIDGVVVETVDTYRADDMAFGRFYPLASNGTHTISATLTSGQHPNASDNWLRLDYIDVWDGNAIPGGTQEIESIAYFSDWWNTESDAVASGGDFLRSWGDVSYNHYPGNVWIPFEGDSVQFDSIADANGDPYAKVFVDGVEQPSINLWGDVPAVRTFAFDGFGAGAHMMRITGPVDRIALDTVTTPATQPIHTNPAPIGLVRFEENALTYDGSDWAQRPSTWARQRDTGNVFLTAGASGYVTVRSNTPGATASLTFTGSWANVGLHQNGSGGSAEIYIDGILQDTINLNGSTALTETQFAVATGTHTISVTVVGDGQVTLDYIDIYDDTIISDGETDAWVADVGANQRVHFSNGFSGNQNTNATNDRYVSGGTNTWYTFIGDSVTFYAFSTGLTRSVNVYIDGQFIENVSLKYDFTNIPLEFHYTGLGAGPHTIRIQRDNAILVDGFAAPATNQPYLPRVEWYGPEAGANAGTCGLCSGIVAGDINGDGVVEIVFGSETSSGNKLFVYRGDGADTGDGDAIVWSDTWSSGNIGTPALGELDPTYPGTEIVVLSGGSLRVYHADGDLWWEDTSIQMYDYIGAPALGNLDADPEPEIVVNAKEALVVLDADGTVLWSVTKDTRVGMPMLADMTGDGLLDIVFSEKGKTTFPTKPAYTYLYDYNLGSPNLVWTTTYTTTMVNLFGSHAIADIDGLQPGGDDGPEIAISTDGYLTILDADGSKLWTTELEPGAPGGVSIADLDGDGEVEIVTGMKHEFAPGRYGKLYAVNADGSLLWGVEAEDSTSANSSAVLDLNGDGIYEVAWNGLEQGFNIFNGLDGSVLFHEPAIFTRSGTDHPLIVDVDGDDSAEIVIATQFTGIVVLGFDGMWGDARSIWNQHTYHITNVNDDLSIPTSELNSWDGHNTYKTQTPEEFVLPIFGVTLTHTVGTDGLSVDGFNVAPDVSADPDYLWNYVQTVASPTVTRTLDIELSNMEPGETRLVATGTVVSYTLGSGQNTLTLPPLYVTAAKLIAIEPFSQTVGAGSTATFIVTLTNPTDSAENYALELPFLSDIATLPATVNVPANSSVDLSLTFATPETMVGTFDFLVLVNDGTDSAAGRLVVVDALDLALSPPLQSADPGQVRSYMLTVTNTLPTQENIVLSVIGLPDVNVPATVVVDGNASETVIVTAQGFVAGQLPFTINGENGSGASDSVNGFLAVSGSQAVSVALDPNPALAGPGTPAVVTVTVTNTGGSYATFDLSVDVPAGWSATLARDVVALTPYVFNATNVRLIITPPPGAAANSYPYAVTATGRTSAINSGQPAATTASGTVNVSTSGAAISIDPASRTLLPSDSPTWNVTVTNTGSVQDTFVLTTTGIAALSGVLSQGSVTLNAGQSTTVQLSAADLSYALPRTYTFAVAAIAQSNSAIRNQALADVTFGAEEALLLSWTPTTQTVSTNETAYYLLTITNTGNLLTDYNLSIVPAAGAVNVTLAPSRVSIPARMTAQVLVAAASADVGLYDLVASAESDAGTLATAVAQLEVMIPTAVELSAVAVASPSTLPPLLTGVTLTLTVLLLAAWVSRRRRRGA